MFQTVPLSIIRSTSLYTQQWYMSHRFADSLRAGSGWNAVPSWSCSQAVSKHVWHTIAVCTVKNSWWWTEECPKHVEFHSKNKFEKLVHLVGFIIRNLSRCTVTGTSNCSNLSCTSLPLTPYKQCLSMQCPVMTGNVVKLSLQNLYQESLAYKLLVAMRFK
jgi:hypothetical protein